MGKSLRTAPGPRPAVAKRYYRRSDDLHKDEQRRPSDGIVVYSRLNPDEDDTVMEAQWRISMAIRREHSLHRSIQRWWRNLLCIPPPIRLATPILDHVLLGSDDNASSREQLSIAGVTHICNCAAQAENHFEREFVYLKLHLRDSIDQDLVPHFQAVARFLHRVEKLRGRALIHCLAGVSRSAALLIGYLMIHKNMTLLEAYGFVRSRRPCVQPNQAFRLQLAKYELMLRGASSVAKTQDPDWNFFAWNELKATSFRARS